MSFGRVFFGQSQVELLPGEVSSANAISQRKRPRVCYRDRRGNMTAAVQASAAPSSVNKDLNDRVAAVRPSKTMQLTDLATSMKEKGVDVLSLAAGEPDFDTPESVIAAGVEALRKGLTHYTPNAGTQALRAAICHKLRTENGLEYTEQEVLVSNGAKQSVWQGLQAVCSEGDEVIIPAPFWVSYPEMARMAGAHPIILPSSADEGFLPSAEQIASAITPKSRLLILCTPSNPSGAVFPLSLLQAIAEVVRQHPRLLVLSDEIYEHIIYPPGAHHSFAALEGMHDRTLTVNGFSKAFAMTGWRLGYLAAPRAFTGAAARIQGHSTSGASSIAQHAGLAALALGPGGGDTVAAMVASFKSRRDFVLQQLKGMPGVKVLEPEGAFYVLPDCNALCGPHAHAPGFGDIPDDDALCRYLLEKAAVAVVPGSAFGAPNCIRISYAAADTVLQSAMQRMKDALAQIQTKA
ncbi:hypothetical protein WJX73_010603 [Symbiochloris irregularis]|uniref:Aminotransferase class I/classII large domain-containing protein n=1 Tax=Symbiochloris irregularis TaxID=706552 RepID=A0AAW1NVW6_9CHLO